MQVQNNLRSQLPAETLIRFRAVGIAITNYDLFRLERRCNMFLNVLRPIGKHQCQLGARRQTCRARIQQNGANTLPNRTSPGFPRCQNVEATRG